MVDLGYKPSSEEFGPRDLVRFAQRAEEVGFTFAAISDHYHPWTNRQGQSPFVWSVNGAIAQATQRLRLGTAVTCPTTRTHPAIIAQAAATTAALMPGRFFLGLGSGENLNEHILGDHWPPTEIRQARLEEAVEVIRLLWQGGLQSHHGRYYTVHNARLYTLPDEPPPLFIAASGPSAAELAGRIGDGLMGIAPDAELIEKFVEAGGSGKPRYAEVTVCWAADEATARRTAHEWWPIAALSGSLYAELSLPSHFEGATSMVREEDLLPAVVCDRTPSGTWPRSGCISTPASITSGSTRSAPTKKASSGSTNARSYRSSAKGARSQCAGPLVA